MAGFGKSWRGIVDDITRLSKQTDAETAAERAAAQRSWDRDSSALSASRRPEARGMTPTRLGVPDQTKFSLDDPKFGGGPMVGGTPEALARARDQGFDSRVFFHGTEKDFTSFEPSEDGAFGGGFVYLTDSPSAASGYAKNSPPGYEGAAVYPLRVRDPQFLGKKGPYGANEYAAAPKNIRSVHAAFDPAKKDSSDLLASLPLGVGAGLGLFGMGGGFDEAEAASFRLLKPGAQGPKGYLTGQPAPAGRALGYHGSPYTRSLPLRDGATMSMSIGSGAGGRAKDVVWSLATAPPPERFDLLRQRSELVQRHQAADPNSAEADAIFDQLEAVMEQLNQSPNADRSKFALPAFRAAEQALKTDMAERSPFEPWRPDSGYKFIGATPTHEKIYEGMLRRNSHPDYFSVIKESRDGDKAFYLRRKFPFRHEVAGGAAAGVLLSPSDASGGQDYSSGDGVSSDRPVGRSADPRLTKELARQLQAGLRGKRTEFIERQPADGAMDAYNRPLPDEQKPFLNQAWDFLKDTGEGIVRDFRQNPVLVGAEWTVGLPEGMLFSGMRGEVEALNESGKDFRFNEQMQLGMTNEQYAAYVKRRAMANKLGSKN